MVDIGLLVDEHTGGPVAPAHHAGNLDDQSEIDAADADNLLIENCHIHHFLKGSFNQQADAHGIVVTGTQGVTIRNTEIHHVSGDSFQADPSANWNQHRLSRREVTNDEQSNSPQEIEEAAIATDLVSEAVALGIPDDRLGHAVHLVVRGTASDAERANLPKLLLKELPNFMKDGRFVRL